MPRLFVSNVTFEHELAPVRQTLPKRLVRLCSELACMWLAVAENGDWIWCPEPIEAEFWPRMEALGCPRVHPCGPATPPPAGLDLVPWGWSEPVRELARSLQARACAPPQDVLTQLNGRSFSFAAESEWQCGLPGSAVISTALDLESALSSFAPRDRWVLKREHGAAARERLLGQGAVPTSAALSWLLGRRAYEIGDLFLEPWVERIGEAGLQWDVPVSGPPVLIGITPLLCDASGRYLGSCFSESAKTHGDWGDAIEVSRRAAERVRQAGYFGPLGIDAMRYRDRDGAVRLRPLQDINARWTMGRIALGWRRIVPSGTWRHGTCAELTAAAAGRRTIRTSPRSVGGRLVEHCTWIEPD